MAKPNRTFPLNEWKNKISIINMHNEINIRLPIIAPNLPATNWIPKAVDLFYYIIELIFFIKLFNFFDYRNRVGNNSVPVQPNELNVITFIPPKILHN